MRTYILVFVLIGTVCISAEEYTREKRSIGKWFSGMWKKFSKKEPDRRPIIHYYPSKPSYHSFGPPPQPHYDAPYAPHHPSHVGSSSHDISSYVDYNGGGHGTYGGGSHGEHGGHGGHGGHGHGGHDSYGGHHGGGYGGQGKGIPHGFGPLKNSDIINSHASGSYVPTAPHIPANNYESSYSAPASSGYSGESYSAPQKEVFAVDAYGAPLKNIPDPVDTYSEPHKNTYSPPAKDHHTSQPVYKGPDASAGIKEHGGNKGSKGSVSFVPPAPSPDSFVDPSAEDEGAHVDGYISTIGKGSGVAPRVPFGGPGSSPYIPPAQNSISVTDTAYKPPAGKPLPLDSHGSESYSPPTEVSYGSGGSLAAVQSIVHSFDQISGGSSTPLRYSPNLGPDDPIIEIVFEEGEPIPAPPPPKVDPKLFLPSQDDVEVYFIEYSSEDEIKDIKNIDVNSAQPAILEGLPDEIPHDLKNQLLKSGILENAQIEILNLDNAIHNPTIDPQTRHALQQAYSRPHRQVPYINEVDGNNEAVDVRVHKLEHDPKTPRGFAEFLSNLNGHNKGTYAGKVEVNDKFSQKFLPLSVNGNVFPLPENLSLDDKKVDEVIVLSDDNQSVNRGQKDSSFSGSNKRQRVVRPKHRRNIDINWQNADTTGWIPIPNS